MNEATPSPESTDATKGHAPADVAYPKTIKSFVRRAGRTTTGQTKAFQELGPQFILPYQSNAIDFVAAYAYSTRADGQNDPKKAVQSRLVLKLPRSLSQSIQNGVAHLQWKAFR